MPQLIGYGEDALTYRAMTERLPEVLDLLGDATDPSDALVFFRPSFGRRAAGRGRSRGAAFGEFDAIMATDGSVYLVEAKWSRSGETYGKKEVLLRAGQVRRHEVLSWYLRRWRQHRPLSWDEFRAAALDEFETSFPTLTIPPSGRHLAANLEYVLTRLAERAERVIDVLLYGDVDELPCPPLPASSEFRCITVSFTDAHRTGFFPMAEIAV